MLGIEQNTLLLAGGIGTLFVVIQFLLAAYMLLSLRMASSERALLNKEMFGLIKKLEGLTSSRREQMLKHYDKILASLSTRLPTTIAAQTSTMIFETESKILARLAELEPAFGKDESSKKKMDELIKSMENLEQTIVALTADTVRSVMVDSRRSLLDDDNFQDINLAA